MGDFYAAEMGRAFTSSSSDSEEEFDEDIDLGLQQLLLETQEDPEAANPRKKSRMPGRKDADEDLRDDNGHSREYKRDSLDSRLLRQQAEDSRIAVNGVLRLKVQNLLIENQQLREDREKYSMGTERQRSLLEHELESLKLHLDHQEAMHATNIEKLQRSHDHELHMLELEQEKQHISEDAQFQEDLEEKVLEMQYEIRRLWERNQEMKDQLDASAAMIKGLKASKQELSNNLQREKSSSEQRRLDEETLKILENRNELLEKQVSVLKKEIHDRAEEMAKTFIKEKKKMLSNHRRVVEDLKEEMMETRTQAMATKRARGSQKAEVKLLRAEVEKLRIEAKKVRVLDAMNMQMGEELQKLKKLAEDQNYSRHFQEENIRLTAEIQEAIAALDKSNEKWSEAQREITRLREVESKARDDWRRVSDVQTELNTLRGGVNATNYREIQEDMLELQQSNQILRRKNDNLQIKLDRIMMTRGPTETEMARLQEELNAARTHVMKSRKRAFQYIDRISELETNRGFQSDPELRKRIADLEAELEQQVNIAHQLEQERVAISNLEETQAMIESIPLPPSVHRRLNQAFKNLEIRNRKLPRVYVKAEVDKATQVESERLKEHIKVLQSDITNLENQLEVRREESHHGVKNSRSPTYHKRTRGLAQSPYKISSFGSIAGSSRSRNVSREQKFMGAELPIE